MNTANLALLISGIALSVAIYAAFGNRQNRVNREAADWDRNRLDKLWSDSGNDR